ncbi:hypothetical protein ACN6MY_07505 [Peribacillus sp. B-H-3]|uniref:hypothetical protein n=1 Tax=Peribacillus sp. B-H-3 TaxID=3400420 RepID=UPI003B02B173
MEKIVKTTNLAIVKGNHIVNSDLERKVRDSCGISGTCETPRAQLRMLLIARPAEISHLLPKVTKSSQIKKSP